MLLLILPLQLSPSSCTEQRSWKKLAIASQLRYIYTVYTHTQPGSQTHTHIGAGRGERQGEGGRDTPAAEKQAQSLSPHLFITFQQEETLPPAAATSPTLKNRTKKNQNPKTHTTKQTNTSRRENPLPRAPLPSPPRPPAPPSSSAPVRPSGLCSPSLASFGARAGGGAGAERRGGRAGAAVRGADGGRGGSMRQVAGRLRSPPGRSGRSRQRLLPPDPPVLGTPR